MRHGDTSDWMSVLSAAAPANLTLTPSIAAMPQPM